MAGNFEGIKTRNFGIEIEMTGLTRCQAARAIAKVLGGTAHHEGGSYDKYTVDDQEQEEDEDIEEDMEETDDFQLSFQ